MKYKLIINCKNYEESTGNEFSKILDACVALHDKAKQYDVDLIVVPSTIDLKDSVKSVQTYAQHIDVKNPGSQTGYVVPKILKNIGVKGTLISHSEHLLENSLIEETILKAKELGFETCVCARDPHAAYEVSKFAPDMIAVEPQELIGGDISISTAKPEIITDSINAIANSEHKPLLLVGAGIKNRGDVSKAVELGAMGILVASGVVKAPHIYNAIDDLLEGFN
jgi:triosephosphate isomerase